MPARLTAYLPDAAASCLVRDSAPLVLGRGTECGFRIDHPSVSRAHAQLTFDLGQWHLHDLDSKNGLYVDGCRIRATHLANDTWFRLGDVVCNWTALSEAAAENVERRVQEKQANSRLLIEGLEQQTHFPDLLRETLRATVGLAECERGFLLLAEGDKLRVAASHGMDDAVLTSREFGGSVGAVQLALESGLPVVVNDASQHSTLAARESVIRGRLRTLVCLPLRHGEQRLGLLYADSSRVETVITTTDMELLRAFAERAALWLAASRDFDEISRLAAAQPAWSDIVESQRLASA